MPKNETATAVATMAAEEPKKPSADTRAVSESRVTAARQAMVPFSGVSCGLCWARGRAAAIREMLDGVDSKSVPVAKIASARAVAPSGHDLHDRRSWDRGRDAAIATMLGESE